MSTKAEQLALLQKKLSMTKTKTGKAVLEKKIDKLKSEMGSSTKAKKDVTEAKKKVSQMSIAELKKKPEFSFLKGMNKGKIEDDQKRVAKPKGWRFKGKGKYRKPTKSEIVAGKKRGNVYYEARNRRSDVSRIVRLKDGGGVGDVEIYDEKDFTKFYEKYKPIIYAYQGNPNLSVKVYVDNSWYDAYFNTYQGNDNVSSLYTPDRKQSALFLKGYMSYAVSSNYPFGSFINKQEWDKAYPHRITKIKVIENKTYATGGGVKHSKKLDKKQKALHTGKRVSESGNTYYEYRMNHADNDRRTRLEEGGDLFTGEQHRSETMRNGGKVEEYTELRKISNRIADETAEKINNSVKNVSSKMPYKAQWVLEEVVKDLESRI